MLDLNGLSSSSQPLPLGDVQPGVVALGYDADCQPCTSIRNLFFDAAIAEGHIYYSTQDGNLHRMTVNGNEDTCLTDVQVTTNGNKDISPDDEEETEDDNEDISLADVEVHDIKYLNGFVYYIQGDALYRIKADGSDKKTIQERNILGYFFAQDGSVYCMLTESTNLQHIRINPQGSCDSQYIMIDNSIMYMYYSLFAIDDAYAYYHTYNDVNGSIFRAPLGGGKKIKITSVQHLDDSYRPVLLGDYIYYYSDKFYRMNKDGRGVTEIGPVNKPKVPYSDAIYTDS